MTTFAITALLLIMLPGPDQALVTRNALVGGRSGGVLTMLGGALGLTEHAGADRSRPVGSLGRFGEGLHRSQDRGCALPRLAGDPPAARRRSVQPIFEADDEPSVAPPHWAYLRQGFLSNALNPKVALFFVTFLPRFLHTDGGSTHGQVLLLSAALARFYPTWFSVYVASVEHLGRWLRRPRGRARVEQVTGSSAALTRPLVRATQPRPSDPSPGRNQS